MVSRLGETVDELASRDEFIAAMRGVASSVTVVTTDGAGGRHGATVSAFTSVSADPPTVLICLNSGSRISGAVAINQNFNVNVLPQGSGHVADRFAGRHDASLADRFDGIEGAPLSNAVFSIKDATVFCCQVKERIFAATHTIYLATVNEVRDGGHLPLTYLDGGYHRSVPLPKPADKT